VSSSTVKAKFGDATWMKSPSVKSGYVMNNGNPLYFHEWGRVGAPAVLFLGPLRSAAYFWRPIIERLDDQFHCVAVNLRGHGDSGPVLRANTDVNGYVSDVATTINQLGLASPTVIAFAPLIAGAGVAFAAQHGDMLRSLVLIDGGPGLPQEILLTVKQRMWAIPPDFDSWEDAVSYLRGGFAPPVKELAEERAPYVFRRTIEGRVTWKYDPVLREEFLRSDPPPYVGTLPDSVWKNVRCPMLLLVPEGGTAQMTLSDCKRLAQYSGGSRWVEVPNCQHFIQEENPDGFIEALTPFLRSVHGLA
jgi:pimeloyl-ACP methyl ester carboxylesterase